MYSKFTMFFVIYFCWTGAALAGQAFLKPFPNGFCRFDGKFTECANPTDFWPGTADWDGKLQNYESEGASLSCTTINGKTKCWGSDLFVPPTFKDLKAISGNRTSFCAIDGEELRCFSQYPGAPKNLVSNPKKLLGRGSYGHLICAWGDEGIYCWDGVRTTFKIDAVTHPQQFFYHAKKEDNLHVYSDMCALSDGKIICWTDQKKEDKADYFESALSDVEGIKRVAPGVRRSLCADVGTEDWICSSLDGKTRTTLKLGRAKETFSIFNATCAITEADKILCGVTNKQSPVHEARPPQENWTRPHFLPDDRPTPCRFCVKWDQGTGCYSVSSEYTHLDKDELPSVPFVGLLQPDETDTCTVWSATDWECNGHKYTFREGELKNVQQMALGNVHAFLSGNELRVIERNRTRRTVHPVKESKWALLQTRRTATYCNIYSKCEFASTAFLLTDEGLTGITDGKAEDYKLSKDFTSKFIRPTKARILGRMSRIICVQEGRELSCYNRSSQRMIYQLSDVSDFDGRWLGDDSSWGDKSVLIVARAGGIEAYHIENTWDGKSEISTAGGIIDQTDVQSVLLPPGKWDQSFVAMGHGSVFRYSVNGGTSERIFPTFEKRFFSMNDLSRTLSLALPLAPMREFNFLMPFIELADISKNGSQLSALALKSYLRASYLQTYFGEIASSLASKIEALGNPEIPSNVPLKEKAMLLVFQTIDGEEALLSYSEKKKWDTLKQSHDLTETRAFLSTLAKRPILGARVGPALTLIAYLEGA